MPANTPLTPQTPGSVRLARVLDVQDLGCTLQLADDRRVAAARWSGAIRQRGIVVRPGHLVLAIERPAPADQGATTQPFEVVWRGPKVVRVTAVNGHQLHTSAAPPHAAPHAAPHAVIKSVRDLRPEDERHPLRPGQEIVVFPVDGDPDAIDVLDLALDGLPVHVDHVRATCLARAEPVLRRTLGTSETHSVGAAHHPDPRHLVAEGYDRMAERYAAWLATDVVDEARPRYLSHLLEQVPAGARVLELGCGGGGPTTQQLAARFELTGLDISARQIELARANVPAAHFVHADMTTAAFPPDSFDAVVSFYALGHLPHGELPTLLRKIGRWLRPHGVLVATMSGHDPGTVEPDWLGVPMYFSGHAPEDTRRFVEEAGLRIELFQRETILEDGHPTSFLWVVAHRGEVAPTARAYRSQDLPRVAALLAERLAAGLPWNLSASDLRHVLDRPSTNAEQYGHIWEDSSGRLIGFALVWLPWATLPILVHPHHDDRAAEPALYADILRWAEATAAQIARERSQPLTLGVRVRDGQSRLISLLERSGYSQQERHSIAYRRSLATPFPPPTPSPGFTLRHLSGEHEVEAYAALHREAFGTQHMTAESRLVMMRDPDYILELDLVAAAPDGTLAAFVLGELKREESRAAGHLIGSTDPIGTRPAYRRLGLARALLLEAFRRLKQRGAEVTTVGTGSWNTPTQRLLESVGYTPDFRLLTFSKTID